MARLDIRVDGRTRFSRTVDDQVVEAVLKAAANEPAPEPTPKPRKAAPKPKLRDLSAAGAGSSGRSDISERMSSAGMSAADDDVPGL